MTEPSRAALDRTAEGGCPHMCVSGSVPPFESAKGGAAGDSMRGQECPPHIFCFKSHAFVSLITSFRSLPMVLKPNPCA